MYILFINKNNEIIDFDTEIECLDKKINLYLLKNKNKKILGAKIKKSDIIPKDIGVIKYKFINNIFVKEKDLRINKIQELEKFIIEQKEQGFYYNDNRFKLDAVAQNRINMLATNVSLTGGKGMFPLQWFTANGENGTITLNDINDFSAWYTQATMKILEIETKEANYRYMIEQAQTEEELNNIIFE